jgi:release factor glutamine methyltransferase
MSDGPRLEQLVERLRALLLLAPDKPEETIEATARALWHTAAGRPCSAARANSEVPALDAHQQSLLASLVERRLAGEPLAYLTGRQEFLGLEFHTAPGALIPRRETELLGAEALRLLETLLPQRSHPKVLDLCTGCGNLAIAIAHHFPMCEVWAADLERPALAVAADNARLLGVAQRIHFSQGDLFAALEGTGAPRFDLVTCNPPYLSSKHAQNMPKEIGAEEPVAAFDGGPFGVSITLRLIREAPQFLLPGGWLCFELGAGQGAMLEKRLRDNSAYSESHNTRDAHGVIRALHARVV